MYCTCTRLPLNTSEDPFQYDPRAQAISERMIERAHDGKHQNSRPRPRESVRVSYIKTRARFLIREQNGSILILCKQSRKIFTSGDDSRKLYRRCLKWLTEGLVLPYAYYRFIEATSQLSLLMGQPGDHRREFSEARGFSFHKRLPGIHEIGPGRPSEFAQAPAIAQE